MKKFFTNNISENGLLSDDINYIMSLINVNLVPVSGNAMISLNYGDNVFGDGDGLTTLTFTDTTKTSIATASIEIKPQFADSGYLNLHELGHALGLDHDFSTNNIGVSIMLFGNPNYSRGTLDDVSHYGTNDVAKLLTFYGTADQAINGGDGNQVIAAWGGKDTVNGNAGNDTINGNQGNDSLHGGMDNDLIHGGQGNDMLFGDIGNDTLYGDAGNDTLTGGSGADIFFIDVNDVVTDFQAGIDTLIHI